MFGRKKIAMLVAEFLGTGVLTLVVLAVQRSTIGVPYFVGLAAGLVVVLLMLIFGVVSGAQFNPAVTIALWTTRKVNTVAALMYIIVQLLGAWAAYGLYHYFVNSTLQAIGGGYNWNWRVMLVELVGAFIFAFAWAALVARRYSEPVLASGVGIAFALGLIVAAVAGIGLINPALALGTRAWVPWGTDVMGWGTYVLGPVVGAVVGVNLNKYLFADYERELVPARVTTASTSTTTVVKAAPKKAPARKKTTTKKR